MDRFAGLDDLPNLFGGEYLPSGIPGVGDVFITSFHEEIEANIEKLKVGGEERKSAIEFLTDAYTTLRDEAGLHPAPNSQPKQIADYLVLIFKQEHISIPFRRMNSLPSAIPGGPSLEL
ncbi:MAG TPA: hypothetical protein VFR09_08010 [Alphaproteobacteria bacterium]|nr:hypothetical protein [Alphaproteobacteria bacterium]